MKELVKLLREQNLTISSVESLTAGLFAAKLAEVEHASAVLYGGLVTYQSACKNEVLKVESKIIDKYGVVSQKCADQMAIKGHEMFKTDIAVSCTGNAGPDCLEGKEVGLVYMSIYYHDKLFSYCHVFKGERNTIRNDVVTFISEKVKQIVSE